MQVLHRRTTLRLVGLVFLWSMIPSLTAYSAETSRPPNIVIILADDLGYGDVRCYNPDRCKIATPRIDRLASEGIRFTDGHCSSGCCSPSRYTLLTGRYHWRSRLQKGICQLWEEPLIARDRHTIGTLAQRQGYRTACIGKWHLGWDWGIPQELEKHFTGFGGRRGGGAEVRTEANEDDRKAWQEVFSRSIQNGPSTRGFDSYFGTDVPNWPPYCFIENDRTVGIPSELLPQELFQKNLSSLQGPALPEWKLEPILPALGERAAEFIQEQASAKKPFLLYLPLTSPHTPIAAADEWRGKSGIGAYGDFVMETDAIVGKVLDKLAASGVEEETFVFFTSDNGCASYIGVEDLEAQGHYPSGPLRDYKASVYEGGHRIPFIVRWPGVVEPGRVSDQLVHHADIFATLAEILETPLEDSMGEDGFSLVSLLKGDDRPVRTNSVNTAANGIPSLRDGLWKLVLAPDEKLGTKVQLYNLATDIGEQINLAKREASRVTQMKQMMETIISAGRSRPGPQLPNDVEVIRYAVDQVRDGR